MPTTAVCTSSTDTAPGRRRTGGTCSAPRRPCSTSLGGGRSQGMRASGRPRGGGSARVRRHAEAAPPVARCFLTPVSPLCGCRRATTCRPQRTSARMDSGTTNTTTGCVRISPWHPLIIRPGAPTPRSRRAEPVSDSVHSTMSVGVNERCGRPVRCSSGGAWRTFADDGRPRIWRHHGYERSCSRCPMNGGSGS